MEDFNQVLFFDVTDESSIEEIEKDLNALYFSTSDNERYIWNGDRFCRYITRQEFDDMMEDSREIVRYKPITIEKTIVQKERSEFSVLWGLIKIKF